MRRQLTNFAFVALAVAILSFTSMLSLTGVANAGSETLNYRWLAGAGVVDFPGSGDLLCALPPGCPDVATASNGDDIEITGEGTLSVHPKSVTGDGTFIHNFAAGGPSVTGTWTATKLLSFKSYGSSPASVGLPSTWEAGKAIIRVQLFVGGNPVAIGTLTVGCILPGVEVPGGAFEGSTLNVRGGPNFNKAEPGSTLFILQLQP